MNDKDKSYFIKLILAVVVFIIFLIVFGLMAQLVKNKRVVNPQSQVLVSPKLTATPLVKDETDDWKTYRNEEYGFEVKYPPVWSYNEGPLPYTFYFGNGGSPQYQVGIWITPTSNIDKTDQQCKAIVLAGKSGWRCESESWSDEENGVKTGYIVKSIRIEVENDGKFYFFDVAASEQNALERFSFFDQMLSTFKFTSSFKNQSITIVSPNGGEYWTLGSEQAIKWNSDEDISEVTIFLIPMDANSDTRTIGKIENSGSFTWIIPNCYPGYECSSNFEIPVGKYKIKILGSGISDESDTFFSIISPDETADWKTYTNEEYGFEFKYPKDWQLEEGGMFNI
jgi:hypothetical protein